MDRPTLMNALLKWLISIFFSKMIKASNLKIYHKEATVGLHILTRNVCFAISSQLNLRTYVYRDFAIFSITAQPNQTRSSPQWDRPARRPHKLCSICIHSFGALASLLHHFTASQCILNGDNKKAHQLVGQCELRHHSSHSDCRIHFFVKTFMQYRASTRMGELTATTIRHQPFM